MAPSKSKWKRPVQHKHRLSYDPEAFAIDEAVRSRKLRAAARKYGVPVATVFRQIHNINNKDRRQRVLTKREAFNYDYDR